MTKRDYTQEDLLAFLNAIELRDPIRPDEITVEGFAQLRGLSRSVAERALREEVKAGRMVRRHASLGGKFGYAYSVKK
jgi:predicted transcriptional regulator